MNKRSILFFPISVAAFVLCSSQVLAAVPKVDGNGLPAVGTCAQPATLHHFDKIIFTVTDKLRAAITTDQNQLNALPLKTELDIKVKDNPRTVADLKGKILTFLGAADSVQSKNRSKIRIIDVEYAVICALPSD